jgi:hypothetical protein
MSADDFAREFHLTPSGWISGTTRFYGHIQTKVAPPKDRIQTWNRHARQSSPFSQDEVEWSMLWSDEKTSSASLARLLKKYPRPD